MWNPEAEFIATFERPERELEPAELELLGGGYVRDYLAGKPDLRRALRSPHLEISGGRATAAREVTEDLERLEALRDKQQTAKTERSQILEAALAKEIHHSAWFGPDARIVTASDFDDHFNHTDLVAVFEEEDGAPHYLAVDVTTSGSPVKLEEKTDSLIKDLASGRLTTVRWFVDEDGGDEQGPRVQRLTRVPRVVIGTDPDGVTDLAKMLIRKERQKPGEAREPGVARELGAHPLQLSLLTEVRAQLENAMLYALEHFLTFVERNAPSGRQLGAAHQDTAALARSVLDAIAAPPDERAATFDRVLAELDRTAVLGELRERFQLSYPIEDVLRAHREIYEYIRNVHEEKKRSGITGSEAGASVTEEVLSHRWEALGRSDRIAALLAA